MRPGVLSQSGFLADGERLAQVIDDDARALAAAGLTHEQVAAALEELLQAALDAPGRRARVGGLTVEVEVFTGFQICPWAPDPDHGQCTAGGGVHFGSVHWRLTHHASGERMEGPGLIVHLARAHHFFEGPRAPMRVDPLKLARLLGLLPRAAPPPRAPGMIGRLFGRRRG